MTYPQTIFPAATRVGPFRLQPLTLGHELLLQRIESPLAIGNEDAAQASVGAVALAFLVCASPWRHSARALGSWRWRWRLRWHGSRIAMEVETWCLAFLGYRNACWSGPELTEVDGDDGDDAGSPRLALIKVGAQDSLRLTEDQVLDRPIGLLLWEMAAASERRGKCKVKRTEHTSESRFVAYARRVAEENRARLEGAPHG